MKKTLLYLLFLFTSFNFYAQISIVSPIIHCNGDTLFDFTIRKNEIIGDLNPAETTLSYHLSEYDATNNANAIPNPTSFVSTVDSKNIYVRIYNKGNITLKFFRLNINFNLAVDVTIRYSACYTPILFLNATGGSPSYRYSIDGIKYQKENSFEVKAGTYTIYTLDNNECTASATVVVQDITIPPLQAMTVNTMLRCNGDTNAEIMSFVSGGTPPYSCFVEEKMDARVSVYENRYTIHNMPAGRYRVVIKDAMGCAVMNPIEIQEPKALTATAVITDQTITVNATGGTNQYTYAISPTLNNSSTNNTFTDLVPNTYEIIVRDSNYCWVNIVSLTITPPAPLVEGKKAITLNLTAGQTLADINIPVTGIKWYSNATSPSGKTKRLNEAFLPLSTVLVDNTTYYASQTINNIESKERLAVTVKLNTLSNPDFVLGNFKYHPNPVKNVLSIENASVIDEVTLFSVTGKVILDKKINSLHSDLDLSHVATGIYFLKVKSEGREKTIKIVKE
ncbi:T9SS type A sorting domain-containing protein [Flavobacterium sp. LS1R49]|uniref:T9SS type A sorting domain-containing protein n=1 Tax=Flavobacterium shii TaxID=2987687 RepID=A0A9X2ZCJ1_9FLAO|nr:T9SS type A sorting domain-containing protein [Flavobacterium shii]MCV9928055.1 T9SS type A sorting domain-containing protein [Flavobacterium shii]